MSTSNPAPGVGGTAQDGGLSTAATVADGGPSGGEKDSQYLPPGTESSEKPCVYLSTCECLSGRTESLTDSPASRYSKSEENAKTSNPAPGVGGTSYVT